MKTLILISLALFASTAHATSTYVRAHNLYVGMGKLPGAKSGCNRGLGYCAVTLNNLNCTWALDPSSHNDNCSYTDIKGLAHELHGKAAHGFVKTLLAGYRKLPTNGAAGTGGFLHPQYLDCRAFRDHGKEKYMCLLTRAPEVTAAPSATAGETILPSPVRVVRVHTGVEPPANLDNAASGL